MGFASKTKYPEDAFWVSAFTEAYQSHTLHIEEVSMVVPSAARMPQREEVFNCKRLVHTGVPRLQLRKKVTLPRLRSRV